MVKRNKARIIDKFKASGCKLVPIKEEMRCNLTAMIKKRKDVFPGIIGYSDTVITQIDTIIPGQDITFFGERGQTGSTPASSSRFRRGSG
jgi:magnesium chelatase subunit I